VTARLRDRWWLATLGILLLGAILRLWRIVYELPLGADVDSFKFVGEAARVVATGELKPHEFQYPTALRNLLAILYWVGGVTTPRGQHGVARVVAALFGVGMIAAAWRACRGLCGPGATALAVALVALAVEAVTSSRVAGTDTMMACLMALALVQAAQILEGGSTWPRAAAAGALIGLAASTKYTGVLAAPFLAGAIVVAGVRGNRWRMARDLGVAAAATIIAFLIASPWFLGELSSYLGRLRVEMMLQRYGQLGHVHAGFFDYLVSTTTTPEQPWLGTSLLYNGGLVAVAGVAATAAALVRGGRARFFALFVVMLWVATERTSYLVIGLILFAGAAYLAWRMFGHVQDRVTIWLDPWSDRLDKGYQIVQALYGLADGGIGGTGLGLGSPGTVPEAQNDFIFTSIGEELGLLGAAAVLMAYLLIIGAWLRTALRTENVFEKLLAVGLTTIIGVQAFIIVGGVTKLVPLTGVTLPFVSYGGSSLVSNYILIALLIRLSDSGARRLHELPDLPTPAERWAAWRLRRRSPDPELLT